MAHLIRSWKIIRFVFSILFLFLSSLVFAQEEESKAPENIAELETAIKKVLKDTETPAVGLAMVEGDSTIWVTSLGLANLENEIKADANTMFRIGSTSKMFVSLAILKLQEEGRVALTDKVKDLIPEIEFDNPWSDTTPILVAHLLEHTTGWDDIHLTEYALNKPEYNLKEGLDFHPHSRKSRWLPGTRMSYCNSGPPVAAYIVEKITGQRFEDYIQEQFFDPMGMTNMTYFETDAYKKLGATLYQNEEPQDYWNIILRPSGSINASPKDMVHMIKFFIGRGQIDSVRLIKKASLKRMETPTTNLGAMAGLEQGYGLSNYTSTYESFVYQGHNGGVNGGLTDFAYLPNHQVGYVVMINNGNGAALNAITKLIRAYQTKDFTSNKKDYQANKTASGGTIDGYYININPRTEQLSFIDRVVNVQRYSSERNLVFTKGLYGGERKSLVPLADGTFASPENGDVIAVKANDPLDGEVVHMKGSVMKRISAFRAYGLLFLGGLWIVYVTAMTLFGSIWFLAYVFGKVRKRSYIATYFWPYVTCIFFFLVFVFLTLGVTNPFELLGKPSWVSVGITILTIAVAITAVWSAVVVYKHRKSKITRHIYGHFVLLVVLNLIVIAVFLANGVIGMRVWA